MLAAGERRDGRTPLPGWEERLTAWDLPSPVPGIAGREVAVLAPPGYADPANAGRRYPALYLHDGNNCLDRDPFGHGGWQVHTVSDGLVAGGRMAPAIVVLVANSRARGQEYVPGRGARPEASAEGYLDYLEKAVVPFVDARYRTLPGPQGRAVAGSSFGGLFSLWAAWSRSDLFGAAMGMSPSFAFDLQALIAAAPKPPLRVYIDSGTASSFGGDDGRARTEALRDLLVAKGFAFGADLMHWVGQGDGHSERAWRGRLPLALPFLFPP